MIGRNILGDYVEGTNREWLLSNGLGSFCSGSINGNLARSYHGMFIKSFMPPLDRMMTFHKIEENLNGTDLFTYKTIDADTQYIHKGFQNIESFEINPFPTWVYSINGTILEKEIFMPFEKELVVTRYRILASARDTNKLDTNLFFDYRDYHDVLNRKNFDLKVKDNKVSFLDKSMYIYTNGQLEEIPFTEETLDFYGNTIPGSVRKNIAYDIELGERGKKELASSYSLLKTSIELKKGEDFYVIASFDKLDNIDIDSIYKQELKRINQLKDMTSKEDNLLRDLSIACDDFITYRKGIDGKTILAGYPWFGDWGRDTMIALPGLTLSTGRFEDARSILKTFAKYCNSGMLPNVFPAFEGEELQYNTIDAAPWYFFAILKYLEYTDDYDFIKTEIYPTLKDIVSYHIKGTRYNIHIDEKGFVNGGDKNTQLTWMDVKYKDWAVTPRYGKPVEIQALWYNAMRLMEELSSKFEDKDKDHTYSNLANRLKENFEKEFWNEKDGYLYDYIGEKKNNDLRPNQIFVVSLPYSLLSKEKEKLVVDKVFQHLYTSHGLKSLDKENPHYKGIYYGNLYDRDSCYHQGTVWAWPMGHFVGAYNKIYKNKKENRTLLNGLIHHFYDEGCINSVSEIFDGDKPFKARGCFAQAWSVSELLRALKEYC